jgi:hypothetical protein
VESGKIAARRRPVLFSGAVSWAIYPVTTAVAALPRRMFCRNSVIVQSDASLYKLAPRAGASFLAREKDAFR